MRAKKNSAESKIAACSGRAVLLVEVGEVEEFGEVDKSVAVGSEGTQYFYQIPAACETQFGVATRTLHDSQTGKSNGAHEIRAPRYS